LALNDDAESLLDRLKVFNLDLSREKRRVETDLEPLLEDLDKQRKAAQSIVNSLQPLVEAGLATEEDQGEYILALKRRKALDEEYYELTEMLSGVNLPNEDSTPWTEIELFDETIKIET